MVTRGMTVVYFLTVRMLIGLGACCYCDRDRGRYRSWAAVFVVCKVGELSMEGRKSERRKKEREECKHLRKSVRTHGKQPERTNAFEAKHHLLRSSTVYNRFRKVDFNSGSLHIPSREGLA